MSVSVCTTLWAQPCKNLFRAYCWLGSVSVSVGDNEVKGTRLCRVEVPGETAVGPPQGSLCGDPSVHRH